MLDEIDLSFGPHAEEHELDTRWDAVVIGAGPAGTVVALELARAGASVLLVERSNFPRAKVCGCCISGAALEVLESLSLAHIPEAIGAVALDRLDLRVGTRLARINLLGGKSASRRQFDMMLVKAAVDAGATFFSRTKALVGHMHSSGEGREVHLLCPSRQHTVIASVVVVADGLGGSSLVGHKDFHPVISPKSKVGIGLVIPEAPEFYEPGRIYMNCTSGGYLGMVRLEDGSLDLAAALNPNFVKAHGGPGAAAAQILNLCKLPPIEGLEDADWKGTVPLTRTRRRIAGERLFVVGDAASYVEPFTGEGIYWALTSGKAAAPLAVRAAQKWDDQLVSEWQAQHRKRVGKRQWLSKITAGMLRHQPLARLAARAISFSPATTKPFVRFLNKAG